MDVNGTMQLLRKRLGNWSGKFLDFMLVKNAHARSMLHSHAVGRDTFAITGCLLGFEILLPMLAVDSVCFSCRPFPILFVLSSLINGILDKVVSFVVKFVMCRTVLLTVYLSLQLPYPFYLNGGSTFSVLN